MTDAPQGLLVEIVPKPNLSGELGQVAAREGDAIAATRNRKESIPRGLP